MSDDRDDQDDHVPAPSPDGRPTKAVIDLAELSHALHRLAIALARDDPSDSRATSELRAVAADRREPLALALSYVFRHQELHGPDPISARAIQLLTSTLWDR